MGLSPGTRLGTFEIVSPLGSGGMGEVYRARDAKLRRDVAIKVLPEALARDAEALARFEREALAVATLSHPNILAIHDFGSQNGVAYAVTELLEGGTLRTLIAAGPIPQKQVVDLGIQIARGLAAAHEKGIIHRDLKPENLFVTNEGHLKILDFGLSKRTENAAAEVLTNAPTAPEHTGPASVMGTMGYMSPEQLRAQPVDARSDLFSFGAVLYEMQSGKKAFVRDSAAETTAATLMQEPPELSGSGRSVPLALVLLVRHCLQKDVKERFHSARDLVFALEEIASGFVPSGRQDAPPAPRKNRIVVLSVMAAVVLVLIGLDTLPSLRREEDVAVPSGPKRIAVLPFENIGKAEDDYFADGIADEVRGKLTWLPDLLVVARGSSIPYRKTTKTPREIARELRTPYLLTATVRWEKEAGVSRVHVGPELVEVTGSGTPISKWQQSFAAELTGVFQVQSDIASRVAEALGVALGTRAERRLGRRPTQNLAAYDAFLRGEAAGDSLGATDPSSLRRAVGFYEQAVALDPQFSQAWSRLALASLHLNSNSVPSPALVERVGQAAERAVALAPDGPEGYVAESGYVRLATKDRGRELELLEKARRLGPRNAEVLTAAALVEQSLGRWDATVEHLRQAERLDPRSVLTKRRLALALLLLRRYREAGEVIDLGLSIAPTNLVLNELKVMTRVVQGDVAGARAAVLSAPSDLPPQALIAHLVHYQGLDWLLDQGQRKLVLGLPPGAFDDDRGVWGLRLAQAFALAGDASKARRHADEARRAFEKQLLEVPDDPERQVFLGVTLAYLGRKTEALRAGERGAALAPVTTDAYLGPLVQHQLVRVYILVGEHEKALDRLEPLLKIPYTLSPAWLRIDPTFDPLRANPRFRQLLSGGA